MCSVSSFPSTIRWAFNCREWRPSAKEWNLAAQCVQEEEKERIYRFVYAQDAKASIIGQLLMRKASSDCTGIPYNEICFSRTESGKPFISNYTNIIQKLNFNFNVSHHGDFCVLAAERGHNVGVDVMKIEYTGSKPVSQYFNLMKKQFSHEEMEFITSPGLEFVQLSRFYRLWCLKESFVKAEGTGISYNLRSVSFHCPTVSLSQNVITNDTKLTLGEIVALQWKFEETLLDENHCVSVAIEHSGDENFANMKENPAKFFVMNYDDLMKSCIAFESTDEKDWLAFCKAKQEKPA